MKKNSFKFLVALLILSLSFSLAGCGAKQEPPAPAPAAPETSAPSAVETAANAYFANMPQDVYKISQKDFIDKVKAGEDMFILDIRQADVYDKGHVKGAVNAPWGTAISDNLSKLPKDKTLMVYCYTGQTAGQAVALLNMAGFDAKSVNLGWDFGISKVEGIADVTETESNDFPQGTPADIPADVKTAVEAYFKGLADVKGTTYANYKISEDDAKALLDAKDDSVIFLSIRSAEDYAKGHIESAMNIPFGKGMEQKFNTLPKDKKIIVYCYTGQTAGQTVAGLKMLGYDAVSLNGGMGMESNAPQGWINKGFPVVQ
ncbi:sulfurtransferase [Geosporobacter ferrireducens]|uniref:Sulfurtransferase n=2 Tax=Geosporobacter ferrireducens TaxID=1424294 RepID=A0A1D8GEU4_9FIRM|nr:sulfurtransferase [Geosporobacter ferrireducens]